MDLGLLRTAKISSTQEEIFFEIGSSPPIFQGINKLVQIFLVQLITDPGTDALDMDMGGGLASLVAAPINILDLNGTRSQVNVRFGNAQRQMIAEQQTLEVPENEQLKEAIVKSVTYNKDRQELQIDFIIVNARDERALVRL